MKTLAIKKIIKNLRNASKEFDQNRIHVEVT
jgi:hypothetical protein